MSEPLPDLDLKFLPDWLKEGPAENRYAQYEGEREDRGERRGPGSRGGGFGDRPQGRGPRPPGREGERRGPRGDRPPGGGGDRRGSGGPGGRREGRGPRGPGGDRRPERAPAPPPVPTAKVRVEFLPEPNGAAGIGRQIKGSARAYPLFGTARLFLERPERHRVRITSEDPNVPLFQIGDGPVSFDRTIVERNAFREVREKFYSEETTQIEPPKGNFTKVARSRTTGALLGPTNHHAYQVGLRKLYEERFSKRMSFPEFLHQEIEIVADPAVVEQWKEQASSKTTYTTTTEPDPQSFESLSETEAHFRRTYLPGLLKTGLTLECSGQASRALSERPLAYAMRDAWEKERAFPAQLVNSLRPTLTSAGLHFFKHRKRVLYISAIRPVRHAAGQVFSEGVASILRVVEESPKCTRRDLAVKILGEQHDTPEVAPRKSALAADLHYLIYAGHVIEFHDGTLDLPLIPGAQGQPQQQGGRRQGGKPSATPSASAPVDEQEHDETAAIGGEEALSAAPEASVEEASLLSPVETAGLTAGDASPAALLPEGAVAGDVGESASLGGSAPALDRVHSTAEEGAAPLLASSESLAGETTETPIVPVITDDAPPEIAPLPTGDSDASGESLTAGTPASVEAAAIETSQAPATSDSGATLPSSESLTAETLDPAPSAVGEIVNDPASVPLDPPTLVVSDDSPTPASAESASPSAQ